VSGLGLALHAGIPGHRGDGASWARQSRRPKALPDEALTLVPCLPFEVEIALPSAGPWSLATELVRDAESWHGATRDIDASGRVTIVTPAPPDGWVPGRYLVKLHLRHPGGDAETAVIGGYELLPMRFSI